MTQTILRAALVLVLACGFLSGTALHARAEEPVAGIDRDGDGLWDDEYALFLYAMGAKGFFLPPAFSKVAGNFVKDWRRHAGLPSWNALKPDQRAYFNAWFWNYQETIASADTPARSIELARNLNSWIGCYQPFRMPLKQMIGIGPFLQQVMQARYTDARFKAGIKASGNVGGQTFELATPDTAEACRTLLQGLPFKAYSSKF